jgi:hypothetical protein
MRSELTKVIPSFVRRADPNHPHYSGFRDHQIKQAILVHRLANAIPPGQGQDSVSLVEFDSDAEIKVLSALAYPASQSSMAACKEWAAMLTTDQRTQIFRKLAAARSNRRHKPPRATELAVYTFDLVGDFGMYRDLHRHRMLTQERQTLTTRLGYEVPDDVREAGVETSFRNLMNQAADSYEIIAKDYPLEAQYIVPMAYRIRWTMTVNLRALIWLCELRSQPQGHPAYRSMAIRLSEEVARVHQDFSHLFRFMETGEHTLGRRKAERRQTKIQVERDEADAVRIATNQLSLDL